MDQARRPRQRRGGPGKLIGGESAAAGVVELSVQLDRARSPHDLGRLVDGRLVEPGRVVWARPRRGLLSRRELFTPAPRASTVVKPVFADDVAYRLFLRAKLRRHVELAVEDEKRAKNQGG